MSKEGESSSSTSPMPSSSNTSNTTLLPLPSLEEHRATFPDDLLSRYRQYEAVEAAEYFYGAPREDVKTLDGYKLCILIRGLHGSKYDTKLCRLNIEVPCRCCVFVQSKDNGGAGVSDSAPVRPCFEVFDSLATKILPFNKYQQEKELVALYKKRTKELFIGQDQWKWDSLCADGEREFTAVYLRRRTKARGGVAKLFGIKGEKVKWDWCTYLPEIDLGNTVVHGDIEGLIGQTSQIGIGSKQAKRYAKGSAIHE